MKTLSDKLGIGTPTPEIRTGVVEIIKEFVKQLPHILDGRMHCEACKEHAIRELREMAGDALVLEGEE